MIDPPVSHHMTYCQRQNTNLVLPKITVVYSKRHPLQNPRSQWLPTLGIPWTSMYIPGYTGFGILLGQPRKTWGVSPHRLHCVGIQWPFCDLRCRWFRSRMKSGGGCMGSIGYRDICDPLHAQDTILGLAMVSDVVKTRQNLNNNNSYCTNNKTLCSCIGTLIKVTSANSKTSCISCWKYLIKFKRNYYKVFWHSNLVVIT